MGKDIKKQCCIEQRYKNSLPQNKAQLSDVPSQQDICETIETGIPTMYVTNQCTCTHTHTTSLLGSSATETGTVCLDDTLAKLKGMEYTL